MIDSEDAQNISRAIQNIYTQDDFVIVEPNEQNISFIHIDYATKSDGITIIVSLDNNYYPYDDFVENETNIMEVIGVGDSFKKLFSGIENATTLSKKEVSNIIRHEMNYTMNVLNNPNFQCSIDLAHVLRSKHNILIH